MTVETLGMTTSACAACRRLVPAKIVSDGGDVFFRKFCPEHGESVVFVRSDTADYLRTLRYVKPAWVPREFAGNAAADCPRGCGFCDRHEQHLCLPIIEITGRCDLACPACIVNAGGGRDMTLAEFRRILDGIQRAERQVDLLNISGGEPLLHPELLAMVDDALARPCVVRVSISTNGLRLLSEPHLLGELHARNVCISLQLDGFAERPYEVLRGRRLLADKRRILDLLAAEGISTSLTMTAAGGVNDDQFGPMLDYLFSHEHVVSMMVQPLAFAGRGAALAGNTRANTTVRPYGKVKRLSIPDVVRLLNDAGHSAVSADDFVPLPCGHPLCFSLAFYLVAGTGRIVPFAKLVRAGELLDALSNRVFFGLEPGEYEQLRAMVYDLWSGPAGSLPDSEAVIDTIRGLLRRTGCCGFDPRKLFAAAERRVKSIFIHAFQDADTFDLARARRCCNAYPQPDGRLVPACVRNVLRSTSTPAGGQ